MGQHSFEAKDIIVREGDPGTDAFVVISGRVELVRQVPQGETLVAMLTPGMCFGEANLLEAGTPYHSTARAAEKTVVENFTASDLDMLLKQLPGAYAALLHSIISRFRRTFVKPEDSAVAPGAQKGDFQRIVLSPASDVLAAQIKEVIIAPASLPFRIGGFPAENPSLVNRHNHLNIASSGPPLMVSRQHCEIDMDNDQLRITDLGSRFCTIVNGLMIGRGRGKYQAPLQKGKNEVVLGNALSPYRFALLCE
jgi:CRP-like cAMP-binding protein